jgi:zinc protease
MTRRYERLKSRTLAIFRTFGLISILLMGMLLPTFAETGQVKETILPNGLKILTKEVHAAPVVSFMVWYKVGSRNEEFGKTGLSHMLEHMQFKGTKTLKKGDIDRLIRKNGGIMNAATSKDFTYYWETLSSDKLELAMRIESDRMVNSRIDPKDFLSERVVVRSELEGDDNNPDYLTYYEVYSAAFKAHPYHWPTIGWVHDVEGFTRDDVYKYYKKYYKPNNATVVIVGDFDTQKALALAKKYFGGIPKGSEVAKVTALEPEQTGERTSKLRRAGVASRVMIGFHTPEVGNPDIYALDVLQMVLGGGNSSRLYKALVEKQLATDAWAQSGTAKDPDLFTAGATARDGIAVGDVEAALRTEIDRVAREPITDAELQKALNQLEADFIYGNDSVSEQADRLGNMETILSWRYLDTYLPNVRKVTKADVQRVAAKYLVERNRTVVTYIPDRMAPESQQSSAEPGSERISSDPSKKVAVKPTSARKQAVKQPRTVEPSIRPTRVVLDNGMVVIIQENRSNPTVAFQGSVKAGGMFEPKGKYDLASLTARMLLKGTTTRTAEQIAADSDFVGMDIATDANAESATFGGRALSKNLDLLLDLLSDSLRHPTFPVAELDKLKSMRLSEIRAEEDDPGAVAGRAFAGAVFPEGNPYYRPTLNEEIAGVSGITSDDVTNFYNAHYGPQTAILTIVGDVDTQQAIEKIKARFGDWKQAVPVQPVVIPQTPLQDGIVKKVVTIPEKSQVNMILGYAGGLKRSDPDFYAANVMNFIVGGDPFGSRLGRVIRDEMGLVYDIHSFFDAGLGAGAWSVELGSNPKNADKAIGVLVSQMKRVKETGVTDEEVKEAIDYIAGSFPVRLEKNSSLAMTLHNAEFYGLGMDYVRKYQSIYRSITVDQVNAAVKKYLHPDKYTLVITGTYPAKGK